MIYSEGISMRHQDPLSPIDALKDFVHATEERAISIEIVDIVTSIDSASSRNTKHFFPYSGNILEGCEKLLLTQGISVLLAIVILWVHRELLSSGQPYKCECEFLLFY